MKAQTIPTRQDDPAWFMFFRLDEITPFLVLLVIGIITRHVFPCMLAGWLFSYLYKRFNSRFPKGFVLHWCYGHGIWFGMSKTFRDPFNRRYLPALIRPRLSLEAFKIRKEE